MLLGKEKGKALHRPGRRCLDGRPNWIAKKYAWLMSLVGQEIDVEATARILDEQFQAGVTQRDAASREELAAIEQRRAARRQEIDQQERGALDVLGQDKDARHVARKKEYDAEIQAAQQAVAEARQEWQSALDEAARKRAELSDTTGPGRIKEAEDLAGLDLDGLTRSSVSVQGTFSAMAAGGLGTGGTLERVALRGHGFHTGYWRDEHTDLDRGLVDVFAKPEAEQAQSLCQWHVTLQGEADRDGLVVAIWHPQATEELVRQATGRRLITIRAESVESALAQWHAK